METKDSKGNEHGTVDIVVRSCNENDINLYRLKVSIDGKPFDNVCMPRNAGFLNFYLKTMQRQYGTYKVEVE